MPNVPAGTCQRMIWERSCPVASFQPIRCSAILRGKIRLMHLSQGVPLISPWDTAPLVAAKRQSPCNPCPATMPALGMTRSVEHNSRSGRLNRGRASEWKWPICNSKSYLHTRFMRTRVAPCT
mmetsp:Transcript_26226/g.53459  ORF Transcript_26226/g.53459 Transcript_26226/m.53459 type:complete len:123 (-) Transcript_26226:331-699(-)